MSLARAHSISLLGLTGTVIEIEAEISSNLPSFVLVGLPDASLHEAKDRVRAAAHNSGLPLPGRRVTVNLSPASVPKRGSGFDLAIALAIFGAAGSIDNSSLAGWLHLGELGLGGEVRPIAGVLAAVLAAKAAGHCRVIVPLGNLREAQLVEGMEVLGASSLSQVARFHGAKVAAGALSESPTTSLEAIQGSETAFDLSDVIGQDAAVNALTVAAAGGHHMLMVGPPGVGKTMLAERLPSILPPMSADEAIETSAIESIAGLRLNSTRLREQRPFEAPHHSASVTALIGGGAVVPKPGMVSLAHNGVVFLDEAPEFQRPFLEALRQPLESGEVCIARTGGVARFPARFQLILAANPCPCGGFSGKARACVCATTTRMAYLQKLSGPLMDRIDIRLMLTPPNLAELALANLGAVEVGRSSFEVRSRVIAARMRASERLKGTGWSTNAQVPGAYLRKVLKGKRSVTARLDQALERGAISLRGYDRCLRLAWTYADLAGASSPSEDDVRLASLLRGNDGVSPW